MLDEAGQFIEPLLPLCKVAGDAICRHYASDEAGQYQSKSDESPVTRADLDSHRILLKGLNQLSPDLPVLSEESGEVDLAERLDWQRYWLVDPLDGTKEFLGRTGEFTINIALIENHRPVLGLLYIPLSEQCLVGIPGRGAWRYSWQPEGDRSVTPLAARQLMQGQAITVLASRRHGGARLETCLAWLQAQWGGVERDNSGSALKFGQLAAGDGDFYPRFSPCCEWDTAAGQALLEGAGGAVLGLDGNPLRYNLGESLLSPNFYALAEPGHSLWAALLERGL